LVNLANANVAPRDVSRWLIDLAKNCQLTAINITHDTLTVQLDEPPKPAAILRLAKNAKRVLKPDELTEEQLTKMLKAKLVRLWWD
jgi:hypothetical protein